MITTDIRTAKKEVTKDERYHLAFFWNADKKAFCDSKYCKLGDEDYGLIESYAYYDENYRRKCHRYFRKTIKRIKSTLFWTNPCLHDYFRANFEIEERDNEVEDRAASIDFIKQR